MNQQKISVWFESRKVLGLAFPMILGLLAQQLLSIADTAMIGRVGVIELAACAFANAIFWIFLLVGYGFGVALTVMTAEAVGSARPRLARYILATGLISSGLLSCLFVFLMHAGSPLLRHFGQDPAVVDEAIPYFLLLSWSVFPLLIFNVLKCFSEAHNRVWAPLFYITGSVFLNIFLNWVFIFGNLGSPALGLWGAGLATLISRITFLFAYILHLRYASYFKLRVRQFNWTRIPLSLYRKMFRLGAFTGGQLLFEAGAFSLAAILMGMIAADQLAAHQIALTVAATTFMIPLGLSFAVGIRVGQAMGRKDRDQIRLSGFTALGLGVAVMTLCMTAILFFRHTLAGAFVSNEEVAVIAMAASFLLIAGLFQIFDGAQVVLVGALRGLQDVKLPTALIFVAYYLLCIPLGSYLAFMTPLEGRGLWIGLLIGLSVSTTFLFIRFFYVSKRV